MTTKAAPFPEPVKKGSKEKPFPMGGRYFYPADIADGFHLFYIVEIQEKENGRWENAGGSNVSTIKDAKRELKEIKEGTLDSQRWDWEEENYGTQDRAVFHFKVTANTSKEQIEGHIKEVKEAKDAFNARKKNMKKAEFVPPEYPKFRIVKRYIEVSTEAL